jgi:hypothetical protein
MTFIAWEIQVRYYMILLIRITYVSVKQGHFYDNWKCKFSNALWNQDVFEAKMNTIVRIKIVRK